MTLFMDSHAIDGGVKATDVAQAHLADLQTQDRYGVRYLRYWVDEGAGRIFCLVDAPDAEAAIRVHREAQGSWRTRSIRWSRATDVGPLTVPVSCPHGTCPRPAG